MSEHTTRPPGPLGSARTPEGGAALEVAEAHLTEVAAHAVENDRSGAFPVSVFDSFGKSGLLAATVPAEYGGLGMTSLHDTAAVLRCVATADASTALALHVQFSRGLTSSWETRHGDGPTRARASALLRRMAADALVCGTAKDHHSRPTTAVRLTDGWRLDGRKTLVSMAPVATDFVVHARWEPADGPAELVVVLVPAEAPGVTVHDGWDGLGMRTSGTVDVSFDGCRVDDDAVARRGPVDDADDSALAGQAVSSITMLGVYLGIADAARDQAASWAVRSGEAPAVRTLLAETDARLFGLHATVATALDEVEARNDDVHGDRPERGRTMMHAFQCAKMVLNDGAQHVVGDCQTVVGGAAYAAGHPLARMARDVRAGWYMQPYTYVDGVDFLAGLALGEPDAPDYMRSRARR